MFTYRSFSWPEQSEGDGPSSDERSIFPGSLTQNLQFAMVNALFSAFKLILCLLCRAQLKGDVVSITDPMGAAKHVQGCHLLSWAW
jgi:hypothetical protein